MSITGTNSLKGKTWDERFGSEKSNLMKQKLSKINKEQYKTGKSYEQIYGKQRAQEIKQKISLADCNKNIRGKTYKEIYGEKKAKEKVEKQRQKLLGKTYEQKYGKEISKERKEKISKAVKKWTKEKLTNAYKEIVQKNGPILRSEIINFAKKGIISYEQAIINELGSLDKLVEITGIEFKQSKLLGRKGKNEDKILNMIEQKIGHEIIRNYYVAGKYLDGYVPQLNIAFEVDEKYHQYKQVQDKIREEHIKNNINCNIIRINEQEFLSKENNKTVSEFL